MFVSKNILLCFLLLITFICKADPVDIIITGNIISNPCVLSMDADNNQYVNFDKVDASRLRSKNDAGNWADFSITLVNCPKGTLSATLTFTGPTDSTDPTLWNNVAAADSAAENVAIQLAKTNDKNTVLSQNSTMTENVDKTTDSVIFPLSARLITPTGNVTQGSVSSYVDINIEYN